MVDKIIKNNIQKFDNSLLEYSIQIKGLNYLKKKNVIKDELYKKVKSAITLNHTLEINKNI